MTSSSDNIKGAVFMMIAMAGYALNDTMIKLVTENVGLFQAVFLRGVFASILLGFLAWHRNALFIRASKRDWRLMMTRSLTETLAAYSFLTALLHMPLANLTAILQSLPLAVTLCAALFLGAKVGWKRYVAISIGFIGVLMIVRPGGEGFNTYSLWGLTAVFFVTIRDLTTHRLSSNIPSAFVALVTSIIVMIAAGLASFTEDWAIMGITEITYLGSSALFILIGSITSVAAMRFGEISFVAPFRYTALVSATALSVLVFGDIPDFWTICGSIVVVATGIFTFYRENKMRQRAIR